MLKDEFVINEENKKFDTKKFKEDAEKYEKMYTNPMNKKVKIIMQKQIDNYENNLKLPIFQYYRVSIPIIGYISSGKSTFLNCLLEREVLESGTDISTKFVCILRHSSQISEPQLYSTKITSFTDNKKRHYYNFLEKDKICEGVQNVRKEIKKINAKLSEGVQNFRKEIKKINAKLSEGNNKNDNYQILPENEKIEKVSQYFYILKTRIPIVEKIPHAAEFIDFMDVPGLNEESSFYNVNVLPILFPNSLSYIFIFDPFKFKSEDSAEILNSIKNLISSYNNPEVLTNSIFILNKKDSVPLKEREGLIKDLNKHIKEDLCNSFKADQILLMSTKEIMKEINKLDFTFYLNEQLSEFSNDDILVDLYDSVFADYVLSKLQEKEETIDDDILNNENFLNYVKRNDNLLENDYSSYLKTFEQKNKSSFSLTLNEYKILKFTHLKNVSKFSDKIIENKSCSDLKNIFEYFHKIIENKLNKTFRKNYGEFYANLSNSIKVVSLNSDKLKHKQKSIELYDYYIENLHREFKKEYEKIDFKGNFGFLNYIENDIWKNNSWHLIERLENLQLIFFPEAKNSLQNFFKNYKFEFTYTEEIEHEVDLKEVIICNFEILKKSAFQDHNLPEFKISDYNLEKFKHIKKMISDFLSLEAKLKSPLQWLKVEMNKIQNNFFIHVYVIAGALGSAKEITNIYKNEIDQNISSKIVNIDAYNSKQAEDLRLIIKLTDIAKELKHIYKHK